MRNQMIEITNQFPFHSTLMAERKPLFTNYNAAYWMQVYPPFSGNGKVPALGTRQLCPWSMAAALNDPATPRERKTQVLIALKDGQSIIKQFDLPADRIMFLEENASKRITIWVD